MKLALLPETVALVLDEHTDKEGKPEKDAPVWTFRPLTLNDTTALLPEYVENKGAAFVTAVRNQFVGVTNVEFDVPFDAKNEKHWDALNPGWLWELGRKLWERTYLTEQDRGK